MFGLLRRKTPCDRPAVYLASFAARLREYGISDKGHELFANADVCGRTAGLFAVLVNGGARVSPAQRLTDQEFAVLWLGFIGADGATQMIGEDLEFAALSAFAMMIDQEALPRLPDLIEEVNAVQHRLIAEVPNEFGAGVAATFLEWAHKREERGLPVLARNLPDLADTLARFRR